MDFRKKRAKPSESAALDQFRQRLEIQQTGTGLEQQPRAPGFDYVRWKPHGQHRMHTNPDEYVRTCQGLAPYISSVSTTAWEGNDDRRWAGLTTVPPEIPGMQPGKSGLGSQFGSRELLSR